jgi:FlaA1/EpsC-like NDP-sugar epimerase
MATQPFLSVLCLILLDVMHVVKMIYEVTIMKVISCVKHYTSGDKESAKLSSFFKGKTVLITGASSGLGKAMALKIAQCTSTGEH